MIGKLLARALSVTSLAVGVVVGSIEPAPAALARADQHLVSRPGLGAGSLLSNAVDLSGNGRIAAIGAPGESGSGAVVLYARDGDDGGEWAWDGGLVDAPRQANAYFGATVALDYDAETLVVGITSADVAGRADQGRVAVYERVAGSYQFSTYLAPAAAAAGDMAGVGLAIADDGNTIAIGSPFRNVGGNADQGVVTIFTKTPNGSWDERSTLRRAQGAAGDQLGRRVALDGDGLLLMAGSPGADPAGNAGAGMVVPFDRAAGAWIEQSPLTRVGRQANENLGSALALAADGLTVVTGAPGYNGARGVAVAYSLVNGAWVQAGTFLRAVPGANDQMGSAVAISGDGTAVIVGAPYATANGAAEAGVATQFEQTDGVWSRQSELWRSDATALDRLGSSLAITPDGMLGLAGAANALVGGVRAGAAVAFDAPAPQLLIPPSLSGSGVVGTEVAADEPTMRPDMPVAATAWLLCDAAVSAGPIAGLPRCDFVGAIPGRRTFTPTAAMVGRHLAVMFQNATDTTTSASVSASVPVVVGTTTVTGWPRRARARRGRAVIGVDVFPAVGRQVVLQRAQCRGNGRCTWRNVRAFTTTPGATSHLDIPMRPGGGVKRFRLNLPATQSGTALVTRVCAVRRGRR